MSCLLSLLKGEYIFSKPFLCIGLHCCRLLSGKNADAVGRQLLAVAVYEGREEAACRRLGEAILGKKYVVY